MNYRFDYVKCNAHSDNRITRVEKPMPSLKSAEKYALENMGDVDMCCIYYGKDYDNVKVVKRPTEDENYLEKIGLKSGDLSEIASRRDSMVQILLPREVIDKHENYIAQDIFECADVENWNSNDLSLAITRVFSSLLGVEL